MDGLKYKYNRGYLTELIIASLTSDLTLNITYIFNSGEKAYAKRLEKYLLWFKLFKGKFMFINIEFFIFFFFYSSLVIFPISSAKNMYICKKARLTKYKS